jgi:hypothetical protein
MVICGFNTINYKKCLELQQQEERPDAPKVSPVEVPVRLKEGAAIALYRVNFLTMPIG